MTEPNVTGASVPVVPEPNGIAVVLHKLGVDGVSVTLFRADGSPVGMARRVNTITEDEVEVITDPDARMAYVLPLAAGEPPPAQ